MVADAEPTSEQRNGEATAATSGVDARQLAQSSGSYELGFSAVILGLIGFWLDRRLGTTPIFIITFTIAGFIGASASLYYRYKHQISVIEAETAALRAAAEER